jgi:hypothetical protein
MEISGLGDIARQKTAEHLGGPTAVYRRLTVDRAAFSQAFVRSGLYSMSCPEMRFPNTSSAGHENVPTCMDPRHPWTPGATIHRRPLDLTPNLLIPDPPEKNASVASLFWDPRRKTPNEERNHCRHGRLTLPIARHLPTSPGTPASRSHPAWPPWPQPRYACPPCRQPWRRGTWRLRCPGCGRPAGRRLCCC